MTDLSVSADHALNGLKVLYLPKNSRVPFFQDVLSTGLKRHGWKTTVVCGPEAKRLWQDALGPSGTFMHVPNIAEPQPFETDLAKVSEVDGFIRSCELATDTPIGRILLSGERDIGRGFSHTTYHWFHNEIARQALQDTGAPAVMVRRLFAFAWDTLQNVRPDLVLAGEWADPLCFVFNVSARRLGIRCVVNRPSKLWSGRCFWTDDPMMYNTGSRDLARLRRAGQSAPSARAHERLTQFRSAPDTLGYVKQNWSQAQSRGWLREHKRLARSMAFEMQKRISGTDGPAPKPTLPQIVEHYAKPVRAWRQNKYFARLTEQELRQQPYFFLAMHKDPEQALNYQAPFWANQYYTVSLISTLLPAGYKLIVREHRMNDGRRPNRYYKDMRRLPGVVLVDAFDDQFKYIANADLVFTDNGSTGWEALVLNRRVITLAQTFYDGADLVEAVQDPETLTKVTLDRLDEAAVADHDAHDRALGHLLDAEWATTASLGDEQIEAVMDLLGETLKTPERRQSTQGAQALA